MSRHFKVTESERSPIIVSALWKQKVNLERDLRMLDSNKQLVVNRITLNQKITIKAFKKKLYQAKLAHARIFGDKEAEKVLRDRSDYTTSHMHTNLGMDPEDEEILKKIWSRSQRLAEAESSHKVSTRRSTFVKSAPVGKGRLKREQTATGPRPERMISPRPQTVCTTQPRLQNKSVLYLSTGHRVQITDKETTGRAAVRNVKSISEHDLTQSGSLKANHTSLENPPKSDATKTASETRELRTDSLAEKEADIRTADVGGNDKEENKTDNQTRVVGKSGQEFNLANETATETDVAALPMKEAADETGAVTTIFDEDNRHERLLELQRQRIRSANFELRVKELCNKLTPYIVPKDYIVEDYYQRCMVEDCRALRGQAVNSYHSPVTQEAEIRKSIGNLHIRSMTLKRLSYNFNGRDNRTHSASLT